MKKTIVNLIKAVFILFVWYIFYTAGYSKLAFSDASEKWLFISWLLYALPLFCIGFIFNADVLIEKLRKKAGSNKLNILLFILCLLILFIVPLIISKNIPILNSISDVTASVYFSDIALNTFGIGAYMALCLCTGHIAGNTAGKYENYFLSLLKYIGIILVWFIFYDVLFLNIKTSAAPDADVFPQILIFILPAFIGGILLNSESFIRGLKNKAKLNKPHLAAACLFILAALIVPVYFALADFGILVFENKNIFQILFNFFINGHLEVALWLCAGYLTAGSFEARNTE